MSDFNLVVRTLGRIAFACRTERVADPKQDGRVSPVSANQAVVLSHLDPIDPAMVGELAAHMGVTASTMSLTLKRLGEAGLVRRDRDPADRRVVDVRLTEAGARVRDAHTTLDAERVERMLAMMRPGERQEALRGLGLLADAAEALVRRGRAVVEAQVGGEIA